MTGVKLPNKLHKVFFIVILVLIDQNGDAIVVGVLSDSQVTP